MEKYQEATNYIKEKMSNIKPKVAIVLGSGLGVLSEEITEKTVIKYNDIPNFPVSTISGHAGELIIGKLKNVPIIAMNGRTHYYEGYSLEEITFPIRVFKLLGIEDLILTNAAGGINKEYAPGDFMIIGDHLSFFAESALRGENLDEFGPRFPDMSEVYSKERIATLKEIIEKYTGKANVGVYAYMKGPNFETPAEIRALRTLGADAVGMSTVPEAIIANHCSIKVSAISCITNMGAGILNEKLSHEEVKETAEKVKLTFKEIIKEYISCIMGG